MGTPKQLGPRIILYRVIPFGCYDPNTGVVAKTAFLPFRPKDEKQLSVSDSRLITAKDAYYRYASDPLKPKPDGVMAITPKDCQDKNLPVNPDALPDKPDHVLIDFRGVYKESQRSAERAAAYLRDKASERLSLVLR